MKTSTAQIALGASTMPRVRVLFCCLNGSKADGKHDDPTLRRMMGFAARFGARTFEPRSALFSPCGRYRYSLRRGDLTVVNAYGYAATNPGAMLSAADPVGPDNDIHILAAVAETDLVIAGWGVNAAAERAEHVVRLLTSTGLTLHCLGTTADGHPRHPLYLPAETELQPYRLPMPGRFS